MTKIVTREEKDAIIQGLKDFALENYDHKKLRYDYFIETFEAKDWEELGDACKWSVTKMKASMKDDARMWYEQERNCGAGEW